MATLFDLQAVIRLNSDQFENGVKKAEKSGSSLATSLKSGLATAAKVGAAAIGAASAAAGAMSAAFVKGTSELAQYGDNIDKMSQKMGLSAEAYQEWDFIMQHSGTSMETLKAGMKTLANAVDSGNDAFQRLGISQNEIASLNQEELFARTIGELQKVEDTTERTYLAGQLLGRGATELGALLNTSAEDTEAMRKQVHELGGVMSNEAVKAAAAYQDSLQNMKTAFSGIQRGMLSEFLPSMVTVMDGLALIFSGNDSGIAKITDGVNQFADKLMKALPKIFEFGEGIISSIATAISENLPTLVTSGVDLVFALVNGMLDNIDMVIDSVLQLIDVIVDKLIENLPKLIEGGVRLIIALAGGLIKAIPQLVKNIPAIIAAIVKGLAAGTSQILEVGKNIVRGIWQGISAMGGWIREKVTGFFNGIVDGVKGILGIHSPSKVFAGIGENMALGLGEGWNDEFGAVKKSVAGDMDFVGSYTPSIATAKANTVSSAAAQNNTDMLLTAILNKLDGMGVYLDGTTLTGYVDSRLGKQTEDNRRFVMA